MVSVLASGSTGNSVLYHQSILVDIGIPYSLFAEIDVQSLMLVLLTHEHRDHLNLYTLRKLQFERPGIRIAAGEHLLGNLSGFRNIDVMEAGKIYNYGNIRVSPVVLYHDVPNFGWRIYVGDKKYFHATDTAHLRGIEAKGYDYYCLEANYDEETVLEAIQAKREVGEYAHQRYSVNVHLSNQQADEFFYKNKKEDSKLIRLHVSNSYL